MNAGRVVDQIGMARRLPLALAAVALLLLLPPTAASAEGLGTCATTVSQVAVPGKALGQMTVTITARAGSSIEGCSLQKITGSAPIASRVVSVTTDALGLGTPCQATAAKSGTAGFTCQFTFRPSTAKVVVVYLGRPGTPDRSTVSATGTGGSASSTVNSAHDPASLTVTHVVDGTAGTATDQIALTNHGSTNLTGVSVTDQISAGTLSGLRITSNRPATCTRVNGDRVCTLTSPLSPGAVWRLAFRITGQPGATDTNTATATFKFLAGGSTPFSGKNTASATGPLAS